MDFSLIEEEHQTGGNRTINRGGGIRLAGIGGEEYLSKSDMN